MSSFSKVILCCALLIGVGCGLQLHFKPLAQAVSKTETAAAPGADSRVVYRFFDEDFVSGGYAYNYPEASKVLVPEESGHESEVSVLFNLEAGDYSGGSICLYNLLYDLTPYVATGALQFWVKGETGGEIAWAALVDEENSDGKKTVVRLPVQSYGGISKEWRLVSIPLVDFGRRGVSWDAKKKLEIAGPFDWDKVSEFRLEIKKGDNPTFKVNVDDIFVLRDVFEAKAMDNQIAWDEIKESIPPIPLDKKPAVTVARSLYSDDIATAYVFGGKTAYANRPTTDNKKNCLVAYIDNDDYSGVTLMASQSADLSALRAKKSAGLGFWLRANKPLKTVFLGLLDVENPELKIQSKLLLGDYGAIDTTWKYFMVPLKRFLDKGKYWDAAKKAEIVADMNWKNIAEIRFSGNKGENVVDPGEPATLYINDVELVDEIPGYVDPQEYWAAFTSDAPEILLHDFGPKDRLWEINKGEKSEIAIEYTSAGSAAGHPQALKTTYKLTDYCDVLNDYTKNSVMTTAKRDWTKYWGVLFDFYTDKAFQPISVQIDDAGKEVFIASAGGEKGWSTILVPFKAFAKFPYWQPPDAIQNGALDLGGVSKLDFKPAGDGSTGSYMIANVRLTNQREVKTAAVAKEVAVSVSGDLSKVVTAKINDGIFGINAALWDGDLLAPATAEYVKSVNHAVLRYPGGLRADEDHWEEVLKKKDYMADADEFLDFCKQTGTQPMITVNYGTGTPEEAARWVKYYNIDKKAGVKLWEVGNELYGDWHRNHVDGVTYGKRAAEFIKAMKAVDPTILVSVVWVLEGEWNREVFESTKDLADAVIVHHYSQHAGEENDPGLLAAPQGVEQIMKSVRDQAQKYGVPGKKYEVWLTEWNSVDFKPGPQTLSIVNGLFVADYLGMLAKTNIEQASYWDIHNDITEQGGDYGYLSRTGAPDGDNNPRPSYWAFKLASESIRGKLVECSTNNEKVTGYLAVHDDGTKALLLINKYAATSAAVKVAIGGFAGGATLSQITAQTTSKGYVAKPVSISSSGSVVLPPYSITSIQIK